MTFPLTNSPIQGRALGLHAQGDHGGIVPSGSTWQPTEMSTEEGWKSLNVVLLIENNELDYDLLIRNDVQDMTE